MNIIMKINLVIISIILLYLLHKYSWNKRILHNFKIWNKAFEGVEEKRNE